MLFPIHRGFVRLVQILKRGCKKNPLRSVVITPCSVKKALTPACHFTGVFIQSKQPISTGDSDVVEGARIPHIEFYKVYRISVLRNILGDGMDVALMTAVRITPTFEQELQWDDCLVCDA